MNLGHCLCRIDDLTSQNGILHQHLESISSQATQIRQAATNPATANVADGDTSLSGQASDELHEVIKYLRREKEIVDLQMELNKQECARLRQSLEHANRTLDETRVQLAEERARGADAASSATQHAELLEKINQLSILRESNATLRDEAERSVRRAASLEQQLTAATAELDPLREQLRTAHVELEACQAQLRLVQEDNARWQARTQQILQKYDRIDPAELQRLEERAKAAEEALEKQKQEASKELDTIKEEAAKTLEQVQAQVEEQKKLVRDFVSFQSFRKR